MTAMIGVSTWLTNNTQESKMSTDLYGTALIAMIVVPMSKIGSMSHRLTICASAAKRVM